ncbi:SAM-dependent methyltransferase [Meiothermus sp. QL-1]|uniref:tRNA (adenine(22)-N(1))-methyltransferase n=1 Tax=Meiothermus sp. QL-1 TaxID=2058095 RepID=UPI000E09E151|nr:tRNA (adenine(22)-N(1))-methyltransferase TrmK [Meiothermus sp. QL-1]RDI95336.1 SAM-dependent methyltransferase [Meiothermus sp. QL-1]
MPGSTRLEPRLLAVAQEVTGPVHADIGADHARLPRYLLEKGQVKRVIVVEKHPGPYANAQRALAGLPAEVRLGDGLSALRPGEVHSLSLSGMGARLILRILQGHPTRLPPRLVLQPNDSAEPLRRWALQAGFALVREQMVEGFWRYNVLTLEKGHCTAYEGLPLELALAFGPLLLRQKHPLLRAELAAQLERLRRLPRVERVQREQARVEAALAWLEASTP